MPDVNSGYQGPSITPTHLGDLDDVVLGTGAVPEPTLLVRKNGAWEPLTKAAAIASPTSDTVGTKAAIDAIRVALQAAGITS